MMSNFSLNSYLMYLLTRLIRHSILMYLMLIFYDTGSLRNKGLRKYKRLSVLISSAEVHGGGEIELGEGLMKWQQMGMLFRFS